MQKIQLINSVQNRLRRTAAAFCACCQHEGLQEELCTGCLSQAVQQDCTKAWGRSKFSLLISKIVEPLSSCVGFLRKQCGNASPYSSCMDLSLPFRDFHLVTWRWIDAASGPEKALLPPSPACVPRNIFQLFQGDHCCINYNRQDWALVSSDARGGYLMPHVGICNLGGNNNSFTLSWTDKG